MTPIFPRRPSRLDCRRVRELARRALREDGPPDYAAASIPRSARGRGRIVAEQNMIVSGMPLAVETFKTADPRVKIIRSIRDGRSARRGAVILEVSGSARALLLAERPALNFLQRLCGIATQASVYASRVASGSRVKLLDTRKTTPTLRDIEKYAVRCGGCFNHRSKLRELAMVKDNHIVMAGGIAPAVRAARRASRGRIPIEVEVETLGQLDEALAAGADIVLLDNMDDAAIRRAVERAAGRVPLEVSGGVTLGRIAGLSRLGVDYISIGALTHSAPSARMSMDVHVR